MNANKEQKLSRATVSLEKDGRRKRNRVLKSALNLEGDMEIDEFKRHGIERDQPADCIRGSDAPLPNVRQ